MSRSPAAAAVLLAFAAAAALPGTARAEPAPVSPRDVVDAVTGEVTGDGMSDRAVLVERDGEVDLVVYVSDGGELRWHGTARGIAWTDPAVGLVPALAVTEGGSLRLSGANDATGRGRWSETITLAFREGRMLVAGYTYEGLDTLTQETTACDVNLLTGKGTENGRTVRREPARIGLDEWDAGRHRPCE